MKEVWKTMVVSVDVDERDAYLLFPFWRRQKLVKQNIIIHICHDGDIVGVGSWILSKEQKEKLKQYYKDNYKQ